MSLARHGLYSAVGTAARLVAGLVLIKLVAWTAGPDGVGKFGQFMSLMSLLTVLAGGGISAAIVKYVAEYRDQPERLARLLRAALAYALCASLVMGCGTWFFSRPLASWLLDDVRYESLLRVLAFAQAGIAAGNYLLAVVNGFMDVRRLVFIQVVGSALSMVLAVWLSWRLGLYGALLALVLAQLLWLVVGIPAWWRSPHFRLDMLRAGFDRDMMLRLATFSVMTLSSALCSPLVGMAVRDHLAAQLGWEQVGYWQAVSRVSDAYLLFLTTAINVHYLPRLAAIPGREALRREIGQAWRQLLPAAALLAWLVYVARTWVTRLLFSDDFAPANALYGVQLAGDVIKIAAFVLSYLMLAKAMTGLFVISEFVFAASYVVLVFVFTGWFGLIGAGYAFTVNYVGYLVFNLLVARRYLQRLPS